MNENHIRKILSIKYTPGIGNVKGLSLIKEDRWNLINFKDEKIKTLVNEELSRIEKKQVSVVTILDDHYPPLLKELHDAPLMLYYYGDFSARIPLGVVGTRYHSEYGKKACQKIIQDLAKSKVEIISGFAYGIDTIAHHQSIECGAKTIAVLACGVDVNYPADNKKLKEKIIEKGGCILSEVPLGTKPSTHYFPMRNRIISGLSLGVLVVEAGAKSGALITAKTALDQNRLVYTIPGSIFKDSFVGNHYLMRQGAILVTHGKQILDDFSPYVEKKIEEENCRDKPEKLFLSDEESLVYSLIEGKVSLDLLVLKSGMSSPKIISIITQLILKKVLNEKGGFYYKT